MALGKEEAANPGKVRALFLRHEPDFYWQDSGKSVTDLKQVLVIWFILLLRSDPFVKTRLEGVK